MLWFVVDAAGDCGEWFDRELNALDHATRLAAEVPGKMFTVTKAVATVTCPVSAPLVERLK